MAIGRRRSGRGWIRWPGQDDRETQWVFRHLRARVVPRPPYGVPVDWRQLDFPSRAGLVATVLAILGVVVPPISVASALVAIAFSGTAVHRAHRGGTRNRVALLCVGVSVGLVVVVVVGNVIYAAGNCVQTYLLRSGTRSRPSETRTSQTPRSRRCTDFATP
jgi:hypothetical protein